MMRLKLEKAQREKRREKEERRCLQLEKKLEDYARQLAELELRQAEELKEIQRQPMESLLPWTPPKKEQEPKNSHCRRYWEIHKH